MDAAPSQNNSSLGLDSRLRNMIIGHDSGPSNSAAASTISTSIFPQSSAGGLVSSTIDGAIVQVGAAHSSHAQRGAHRGGLVGQGGRGRGRGTLFDGGNHPRIQTNNPSKEDIICLLDLPRVPYRPIVDVNTQVEYLQREFDATLPKIEISHEELSDRETIRRNLQELIRDAIERVELPVNNQFDRKTVILRAIGSLKTGNATKGSDMDLALLSPCSTIDLSSPESPVPRKLVEYFLLIGYGARLLSNTRVPIIKCCQFPGTTLLEDLRERHKLESAQPQEKTKDVASSDNQISIDKTSDKELVRLYQLAISENWYSQEERALIQNFVDKCSADNQSAEYIDARAALKTLPNVLSRYHELGKNLDFPKERTGIHLDVNFSNHLAIHNTALLRCYNICDLRIRAMILFVKAWAKARDINSAYKRTLSSYGYVLMVLYYCTNIADPPLAPNLQLERGPTRGGHPDTPRTCEGWDVQFWRDEASISHVRDSGQLLGGRRNTESVGSLLRGFFLHFSGDNPYPSDGRHQFVWTQEVISLRTRGGRLTKQWKNWMAARTETVEPKTPNGKAKEIRHSYLLCIEDPFELSHNVARTVSHDGIVAIRDEFRRAARLIRKGGVLDGATIDLLKEYKHTELDRKPLFFGPNPANFAQRPGPRFPGPQKKTEPNQNTKELAPKDKKGNGSNEAKERIVATPPVKPESSLPQEPAQDAPVKPSKSERKSVKGKSPKENPFRQHDTVTAVKNWLVQSNLPETAANDAKGKGAVKTQRQMRQRDPFKEGARADKAKHKAKIQSMEAALENYKRRNSDGMVVPANETAYDTQFPPLGHKRTVSFDEKVDTSDGAEKKEPDRDASPKRSILSNSPKNSPQTSPNLEPSPHDDDVQRLEDEGFPPSEAVAIAAVGAGDEPESDGEEAIVGKKFHLVDGS